MFNMPSDDLRCFQEHYAPAVLTISGGMAILIRLFNTGALYEG